MLFNSWEFILLFLPVTVVVYFVLSKNRLMAASKVWLVFASLFFYSVFNYKYLVLIMISMLVNFAVGTSLNNDFKHKLSKKSVFMFGIVFNLGLLGYYKYANFFIENVNTLFSLNITGLNIALPLAISFFTFCQIAYLADSYEQKTKEYNFINYMLFVTFFPHLIAGPIVHHSEMMPQFERKRNSFLNWKNFSYGMLLFSIGLFKKMIIADFLAKGANLGFDATSSLTFFEGWTATLAYTFQIYYDFSGYTDMAIGLGYMFNIILPQNFNNPYRAVDIQDFWHRWHMTLSRFLRDYVYIPLGGNRKGDSRTYSNLFTVFLIGGIWHGASWLFIIWGLMHGAAIVVNRIWKKLNIQMPKFFAWLMTFVFLNFTWVFFRATSLDGAFNIIKSMIGLNGLGSSRVYGFDVIFKPQISGITWEALLFPLIWTLIIVIFINTFRKIRVRFAPNLAYSLLIASIFVTVTLKFLTPQYSSPFLYFNF